MKEQFYLMLPDIYPLIAVMLIALGIFIKLLFKGGKQKAHAKNDYYNSGKCNNRRIDSNTIN